jgi:hypothetical protein
VFFKIIKKIKNLLNLHYKLDQLFADNEIIKMQIGQILCESQKTKKIKSFSDYEFKVFSQWGEDGIINFLIENLNIRNKFFVEFGSSDYKESNTRFLLKNKNWSGLLIDSSKKNIKKIKTDQIFWQHDLRAICEFIDKDNINKILDDNVPFKDIGLLSIDVDGNDYWIWENIVSVNPDILIIEYNSLLGWEKKIVVPYNKRFNRNNNVYPNVYYGASLNALNNLGKKKGYALIYCNKAGNNAFFIKKSLLNDKIQEKDSKEVFVEKKFRELRDKRNQIMFLNNQEEKKLIENFPFEEV